MTKLATTCILIVAAATAAAKPTIFMVDPNIGDDALVAAYAPLKRYVEKRPGGETVSLVDADSMTLEASFVVPVLKNQKGREAALEPEMRAVRLWFKRASESSDPSNSKGLDLPSIAAKLERIAPDGARVVLIGNPIYRQGHESDFHFRDNPGDQLRLPSDRHLELSTLYTPFGTDGFEDRLGGFEFLWLCPLADSEIGSELERDSLRRFWSLYLSRQSGALASYSSDPREVFDSLEQPSLRPFEYEIAHGTELAMQTLSRSAGTTGHVVNDGQSLRAPEQFDHFILVDRTGSMKGRGWEAALRRINLMPDGDRFLVYLYSDYHDDPVAFEYVKGSSPSSLVSSLRAIKLVDGKDRQEAVEVPLNMVRRKIASNLIPRATVSIFTDADAKDPADSPLGLDAFAEISKLLAAGHSVNLYTLSDKMTLSWVPPEVQVRAL